MDKIDTNGRYEIETLARDITERKKAEELLCQETLFRSGVIKNVADGLCAYPLTAPIVSPLTTYFWKIMVRIIAGVMIATAAAITPPQSTSA
jgi:hypothetical protein